MDAPLDVNLADSLVLIHRSVTRGLDVSCRQSQAYAGRTGDEGSREGFLDYVRSLAEKVYDLCAIPVPQS